jgi:hypothetical protein
MYTILAQLNTFKTSTRNFAFSYSRFHGILNISQQRPQERSPPGPSPQMNLDQIRGHFNDNGHHFQQFGQSNTHSPTMKPSLSPGINSNSSMVSHDITLYR